MSKELTFARPLVNSGRLSSPTPYVDSALNTPDEDEFGGDMAPGTNCVDAPIKANGRSGWFLNTIGDGFVVLVFGASGDVRPVSHGRVTARILTVGGEIEDPLGVLAKRYDGKPGTVYLIRPDQ